MKRNSLGALVALNGILLLALLLAVTLPGPSAEAQRVRRGRGEYVMVAGKATGREDQQAVYILELKSYRMAAVMFDSRNNRFDVLAGRNISNDLESRDNRGGRR
jgi:hypothetical protein